MTIKPIETKYAGCRFRSRLEARWAVFFDTAEIPWLYEPEGFVLSDGRRYLPDFYLPDCDTWIEVKGSDSQLDLTLVELAGIDIPKQECRYENGPAIMILGPIPAPRPDRWDHGWSSLESSVETQWYWGRAGFGLYSKNNRPWSLACNCPTPFVNACVADEEMRPSITAAYVAARRARFEHGETGR